MTKSKIIGILVAVLIIHLIIAHISSKDARPMMKIGEVSRWNLREVFLGADLSHYATMPEHEVPFEFFELNQVSFVISWVIILLLIFFAYKVSKNLQAIPGRLQAFAEIIVEMFDELTRATLGKKQSRKYLALIFSLFVFICLSNWIGIIPSIWHIVDKEVIIDIKSGEHLDINAHKELKKEWQEYNQKNKKLIFAKYITDVYNKRNNKNYAVEYHTFLPEWMTLEEPTQDLNTTLGLGLMVFVIVMFSAIKKHKIIGVFKELSNPFIVMLPLNIIGEIGKVISHSFRLFGNIKGGAIIMIVISYLISNVFLPIGLFGFFGIFVGTIQAFVFSMLALVYIAVWIAGDEEEHTEHKA